MVACLGNIFEAKNDGVGDNASTRSRSAFISVVEVDRSALRLDKDHGGDAYRPDLVPFDTWVV